MFKQSLYDSVDFVGFVEGFLRPGGLDLTEKALKFANLPKGGKILDLGCGDGKTMDFFQTKQGFKVWGIDQSKAMVAKGRLKFCGLNFVHGKATKLPFANREFDAVFAECVFCLLDKEAQKRAINEAWRVLKPGGKLIVSDLYYCRGKQPGLSNKVQIKNDFAAQVFNFLLWQDCKTLYKNFLAGFIMACDYNVDYQKQLCAGLTLPVKTGEISYYLGIWQKS